MSPRAAVLLVGSLLACLVAASPAVAQCGVQWQLAGPLLGTNEATSGYDVEATVYWDPDGAGPASSRFVVGGAFTVVGNTAANGVAAFDPDTGTWSAFGSGLGSGPGLVLALAVAANGELLAGGSFTTAMGAPADHVARWTGSAWVPLGLGPGGGVKALAVMPNGDVVVGGSFAAGSRGVSRWNGSTWSPVGSLAPLVEDLVVLANGDLAVATPFGVSSGVRRWNGTAWTTLAVDVGVNALLALPNGDLVAGGSFTLIGGIAANRIARWGGIGWSSLGAGIGPSSPSASVEALAVLPSGNIVAGGTFATAGGTAAANVARWNGSTWSSLGSGVGGPGGQTSAVVVTLAVGPNGDLVAGGEFTVAGGRDAVHVARWDGVAWAPLGATVDGLDWQVNAALRLPGGDIVVGGGFSTAGGVVCDRVARWNGTHWSPLGAGMPSGSVNALVRLPNGDLVAGGSFTTAGGASCNRVARWDGAGWFALGAGTNNTVNALAVLPNGDLVAGGSFTTAGGGAASGVARWDGANWSALGTGVGGTSTTVYTLLVESNGDLLVGGAFTLAGGAGASKIARWNGTSWSPLAGATINNPVHALVRLPNGDLVAGGQFSSVGGVTMNRIARWNGTAWSAMGVGLSGGTVWALLPQANGDVVAGGTFTTTGGAAIARWDGATWSAPGGGVLPGGAITQAQVRSLLPLAGADVLAAGLFAAAGSTPCNSIARLSGADWSPLNTGPDHEVQALVTLPNGDVVAGGEFLFAGAVSVNRVARSDGVSWRPLGGGTNGTVYAVAALPNGDIVVGGRFTSAGGVPANGVARWNGSVWAPLGNGVTGATITSPFVKSLVVLPNGDLVAGGHFTTAGGTAASCIARWDGATWWPLGAGVSTGFLAPSVNALLVLANGDLLVGGNFTVAGGVAVGYIARWNGTTWSAVGTGGLGIVHCLATMANGDLVAGSGLSPRAARLVGNTWVPLGADVDGSVLAMQPLPNGSLVVAGYFATAGGVPARGLARWDGAAWSAVAPGLVHDARALAMTRSGDLLVGGDYSGIGRLSSTCPASVEPFGLGCVGSGGANVLEAITLPWVDTTLHTVGSGLPNPAIVVVVTSVTPVVPGFPLVLVFPQAGVGCNLLVAPDILQTVVTVTGTAASSLFLPNTPPLVGVTFYQQMLAIEIGALGAWDAVTATNALRLTAGTF